MAIGKPDWQTPSEASRGLQQAINNIRERFKNLEAEVAKFSSLIDVTKTAQALQVLRQQITALAKQLDALSTVEVTAIANLLAMDNGIVVLKDGVLITRVLEVGAGLAITNADGANGNPKITNTSQALTTDPWDHGWDVSRVPRPVAPLVRKPWEWDPGADLL